MIFESSYRRKAMNKWESEKVELRKEIHQSFEQKKNLTRNPIMYALASILAWFSQ